jgi:2'-hydroxyisoflavone reductase
LFAGAVGVTQLQGDRDGGLGALEAATIGQHFDAAIDTCGYVPRVVAAACRLLEARVDRYLFVSSVSAYASPGRPGLDEDAPLAVLEDAASEDVPAHYGALKAACETVVREHFGGARALLIRPGLIVGPHDPTGRFTYWPLRLARGGEVLAPEPRDAPVQVIDVRDLAGWMMRLLQRGSAGCFNAAGPAAPITLGALLEACRARVGPDVLLSCLPAPFLLERGVVPWTGLPLWLAGGEPGLDSVDLRRALAHGLRLRDIGETIADTLDWARGSGQSLERADGVGLAPEREAELLAAWRAR